MKNILLVVALSAWALLGHGGEKIIFDTDMYTDFDDVGALAMLHNLAKAGECELLATVVSTRDTPAAGMVELINNFYGRGDLPIGGPHELGVGPGHDPSGDPTQGANYQLYQQLVASHPELKYGIGAAVPDANAVYRKALASAPDKSVTICSVGFTTNLRRLLETKGDALSPLDGRALVAQKVKAWYAMACLYPAGREYNAMLDAESSRKAFASWPTDIYFLDGSYGVNVLCGVPAAKHADGTNVVFEVFKKALTRSGELEKGHPSWDEATVLAAVRGPARYFSTVRGRFEIVNAEGTDQWSDDPSGHHLVLKERTPKPSVSRIIDALILSPPK